MLFALFVLSLNPAEPNVFEVPSIVAPVVMSYDAPADPEELVAESTQGVR